MGTCNCTSSVFPFISMFKQMIFILVLSSGITIYMLGIFRYHSVPNKRIAFFNPACDHCNETGNLGVLQKKQALEHNTAVNQSLINSIKGLTLMLEQWPLKSLDNCNSEKSNTNNSGCCRPNKSTKMCVPLTMEDLNLTCPKYIDESRMRCGTWQPSLDCIGSATPKSCLAILVPYRNRLINLLLLAQHLHNLLQWQSISYGLYIIEQNDTKPFNRAKLLNVGFSLSKKYHNCDCFVFHDADKLPETLRADYGCNAKHPRHLIGRLLNLATNKYSPGKLYHHFFGGVVALTKQQFESVNGNSNLYYGWGREDDELSARLRLKSWRIAYAKNDMSYTNLNHDNDLTVNKMPWPALSAVRKRMTKDGLNSLTYTLTGVYCHKLFTLFSVQF